VPVPEILMAGLAAVAVVGYVLFMFFPTPGGHGRLREFRRFIEVLATNDDIRHGNSRGVSIKSRG
jgi:hypothetical protein